MIKVKEEEEQWESREGARCFSTAPRNFSAAPTHREAALVFGKNAVRSRCTFAVPRRDHLLLFYFIFL